MENSKQKRRGFAFYTILVLTGITFLMIMLFAKLYIGTLYFDQKLKSREKAVDAARSCALLTLTTLTDKDPQFGRDKTGEITIPFGMLSDHQSAIVTFDPTSNVPYSTNNLHSDADTIGYDGYPVPAHGAHIIATGYMGQSNGSNEPPSAPSIELRQASYMIVVTRPGITHAAASSGELLLSGHNEAAAVETTGVLSELTQEQMNLEAEDLKEKVRSTTVASAKASGEPLVLEGQLTLYGNAVSAAGIKQVGNDIRFLHGGLPQANSRNVEIPKIEDITTYNPDGQSGVTDMQGTYSGNEIFQSKNLRTGDLVINGDVDLQGAKIYATGNITINGSVTGEGGIISEGSITITGQSSLRADSKVAIVAGGDLTINGTGAERSMFSGLLYSQGKIRASNLSVAGGLVANNAQDPEAAGMEITDTKLINLPEKTKFDISRVVEAPDPPPLPGNLALRLRDHSITLVNPDLGPLLTENTTWNGQTPTFGFQNASGQTLTFEQLPASLQRDLQTELQSFINEDWTPFLLDLNAQNTRVESIFQLDPNQLLTVSGGYKVVLRRPLDG